MSFHSSHFPRARNDNGFTLTEILAVMAIMAILAFLATPAIQSLSSSQSVDAAATELSQDFDLARTFAMVHRTYVRVGLSQPGTVFTTSGVPVTIVLCLFSADGSLDQDTAAEMGDTTLWPQMQNPTVLRNFQVYDQLNARNPDTSQDLTPSMTNIKCPVTRSLATYGSATFNSFVQFNPSGEAGVYEDEPCRYIKISLDQPKAPSMPQTAQNRNPVIVRLLGINGGSSILRAENL